MLLASLYSPEGGWLKRVAGTLIQGVSLGTLDTPNFAPATGYISFFTLILYITGLVLLAFAGKDEIDQVVYPTDRQAMRDGILDDQPEALARVKRQPEGRLPQQSIDENTSHHERGDSG